ncbi:MAG: hypothetical protein HRU17_16005 [Polyangiaceae bacterium]|nr:hypothetical protein [Polyangiaceae bacterium]
MSLGSWEAVDIPECNCPMPSEQLPEVEYISQSLSGRFGASGAVFAERLVVVVSVPDLGRTLVPSPIAPTI